jgi:hypothetical protein
MKAMLVIMLILAGEHFAFGLEIVSRVVNDGSVTYVLSSPRPLRLDDKSVMITIEGVLSESRSDPVPGLRRCRGYGFTPTRWYDGHGHQDHSTSRQCHEWVNMSAEIDGNPVDTRISPVQWDGRRIVVTVEFQHHHAGLGRCWSLYGDRHVTIRMGGDVVHDSFSWMPRQRRPHAVTIKPIPFDMTDGKTKSLYLVLAEPSAYYWGSGELDVFRDTRYRLSFRYKTARGNDGPLQVRVSRYCEDLGDRRILPSSETVLPDSLFWKKADIEIDTKGVTSIMFSITLMGEDVGDAWVDDICLREVGWRPIGP